MNELKEIKKDNLEDVNSMTKGEKSRIYKSKQEHSKEDNEKNNFNQMEKTHGRNLVTKDMMSLRILSKRFFLEQHKLRDQVRLKDLFLVH